MIYTAPYVRNPAQTVETSPILIGQTVYVGASDGSLYGLNLKDGKLQWEYATGAPIFSTISTSGNALYTADFSGNVYGFVFDEK